MIEEEEDVGEMPHLVCRRYPPTAVAFQESAGAVFPPVHENEWCGEHQERAPDE